MRAPRGGKTVLDVIKEIKEGKSLEEIRESQPEQYFLRKNEIVQFLYEHNLLINPYY